jgi:V8-like Glu-specific endopeptidase
MTALHARAPYPDELDARDSFLDELDAALIGPIDGRVQEIRTTRFPWNTIVHLCRDFGDGRCGGCSGILIDPQHVLTAGHCLWSVSRQASPAGILVMPGRRDRKTLPYGAVAAGAWWVPRGFIDGPRTATWDWGMIRLRRPMRGIDRFCRLAPLTDDQLRVFRSRRPIVVPGYPSDRPIGTMWRHAEHLVGFDRRRLFHTVDTCPGHSGSAILAKLGDAPAIIGVHTAGLLDPEGLSYGCKRGSVLAPTGSRNSGVRMLTSVVSALRDPERVRPGPAEMIRLS